MRSGFDTEFVVAAAEVLHECVTADDHASGVVTFKSAHRPESGLEPAVVGFDPIVRVLLGVVKRGWDQFHDHRAQCRRAVGDNLDRFAMSAESDFEEASRRSGVTPR
jgi:hypothetical protein